MTRHLLDVRGQLCPIPVIKTQNRVRTLADGDVLEVLCTDAGSLSDIPAWCRIHGHRLVETRQEGREITIVIEIQREAASK
jgi:tRNA 2-thiouridine synthesizing protein A